MYREVYTNTRLQICAQVTGVLVDFEFEAPSIKSNVIFGGALLFRYKENVLILKQNHMEV